MTARHGDTTGAAGCVTCHAPHEPKAAAATKCASCHREAPEPERVTMTIPNHAGCVSCHRPHAEEPYARCESCHSAQRVDHGKGGERCVDCHAPHAARTTCESCHETQERHAKRGVTCTDCHRPHQLVIAPSSGACAGCHRSQRVATGHQACVECHALPHRPREAESRCDRCHAGVAASAPPGHQTCTECHDVHGGTRGAECARCHEAEQRSPHLSAMKAARGKAVACAECHQPHGPKPVGPPSCQSCHARDELAALHRTPGHEDCASCHGVHRSAPADVRSSCLACHTGMQSHEPRATRCSGCHPFVAD